MQIRDLIKISNKNLKRRRINTIFTSISIIISMLTIIIGLSLGKSFKNLLVNSISRNTSLRMIEVYPHKDIGEAKINLLPEEVSDKVDGYRVNGNIK